MLTTRGARATAEHRAEYDRGVRAFAFDGGIYAHPEVKAALVTAQRGKCAFCESKFGHDQYGDVEHYRPKGRFKQRETDPGGSPGYYWLAYDWDNLLLSCILCNQQFKRELFPLRVQSRRARSHHDDPALEAPVLLHPSRDDPERHITFRAEVPVPRNRSRRGAATIALLGLDRPKLCERRAERRGLLFMLRKWRDHLLGEHALAPTARTRADLDEVEQALAAARSDAGEYAAMVRAL